MTMVIVRRLTKVCRQTWRQEEASRDRELLDRTAIRAGGGPAGALLVKPRPCCHVCGRPFREVHAFYDSLCPQCADVGWRERCQTIDLSGRVALVSGGRVKIGYAVATAPAAHGAAVHGDNALPARRGRALRPRGRLRLVVGSADGPRAGFAGADARWNASPTTCAPACRGSTWSSTTPRRPSAGPRRTTARWWRTSARRSPEGRRGCWSPAPECPRRRS